MKQCPKYTVNSRCIPKCGEEGGRCSMKEKEEWCILKPEEERLNPYYKDYDDWFKWNCRGCSNFFSCGKVKENNIELLKNLSFIPEKCNERVPEW